MGELLAYLAVLVVLILPAPAYCLLQRPRWPHLLGLGVGALGGAIAGIGAMVGLFAIYAAGHSYETNAAGPGLAYGALLLGLAGGGYLGTWVGIIIAGRWCARQKALTQEELPARVPRQVWRNVAKGAGLIALIALLIVLGLYVRQRMALVGLVAVAFVLRALIRERRSR